MKTKIYLKLTSVILFTLIIFNIKAQDPVADMMRAGASDITKLAGLQLTPLGNSFAAGLGGGWYNTAKPHKLLGFDLTISLNMATIPDDEKLYDFATQGFEALYLADGSTTASMPTLIAYDDVDAPEMVLKTKESSLSMNIPAEIINDPIAYAAFQAALAGDNAVTISGNQLNYVVPAMQMGDPIKIGGLIPKAIPMIAIPTPTVQLGIGLVKNTDLMIRYMPKLGAGTDFSIGLWGVGVKHDIKQWIPGLKEIEVFDLSGLFGYTKLQASYNFSLTPDMYGLGTDLVDNSSASSWEGQGLEVGASALTLQILASKKLLFITPYIGLGFTSTSFDITLNGKYPLLKSAASAEIDPFIFDVNNVNNPITANPDFTKFYCDDQVAGTDYFEPGSIVSASKFLPNASIGLRIKLLILTIHAQYTLQPYTMISAGIGLSIR